MENKVSQEAYNKALEILGLNKNQAAEIQKGEEAKTADTEKAKLEAEYQDTIKKAEDIKAKLEGKKEAPKEDKNIVSEEIIKGFDAKFNALTNVIAFKDQQIAESSAKIEELKKAVDESIASNKANTELVKALSEKLGIIEKQPLERKSVNIKNVVDRFEISKGEEAKDLASYKKLNLNKLSDRTELANIMFDNIKKGQDGKLDMNDEFAKAVTAVELGSLGSTPEQARRLSARLMNEHKIIVENK